MKLVEAIAQRIKDLLAQKNLKPYYLYSQGGIPKSTLSMILNGNVGTVKIDTVYQIAQTLGLTLKQFFDDAIFDNVTD